ncbi:MAG TPA: helix-turn-helix domain-containing protein [Steroidobacteraceae bacterium]|nr:helix-turn-helix domain-containing protein [Steroidobacteraceae bacterium]
MSRRSRLHVPGGIYYVVQRSGTRQSIFSDDSDYTSFEELLAIMLARCRTRAHAYRWESSAIHLVVQIADLPVGRLMQRLTSQYARRVHRKAGELGHLFQQRYSALLIDPKVYLLRLVRYLHRLEEAPRCSDSSGAARSSHGGYLGGRSVPWLTTDLVLGMLGPDAQEARRRYRALFDSAGPEEVNGFNRGGTLDPRVLGGRDFIAAIAQRRRQDADDRSLDDVIQTVCGSLAVDRDEVLSQSRKRRLAMARALITWYATENGVATLAEVARRLQRDPSTLFVGVERYRVIRPDLFNSQVLPTGGQRYPFPGEPLRP